MVPANDANGNCLARERRGFEGMKKLPRGALSWALYDWANSAYVLTVATVFFGIFFRQYWSDESDLALQRQAVAVALAGLVVAVFAPFLGALANYSGGRKLFLGIACSIGALSTIGLSAIGRGHWVLACCVYIIAMIGFYCANIFYDALLVEVSDDRNRHFISSLGFSLGYLGSVVLFIALIGLHQQPGVFGLHSQESAIKVSFVIVGIWWFVFALPLLRNVPETTTEKGRSARLAIRMGLRELIGIGRHIASQREILWFLIAYWFYIDGVNTIAHLAVSYGATVGITQIDLLVTIVLVQFVGVPCTLLFGWLGQQFGARRLIFVGIGVYLMVTAYAATLTSEPIRFAGLTLSKFYLLGFLIGLVQGGLQSLSRSFFTSLIPAGESAAYFGFYNMVGKAAAIVGPALMGIATAATGNPRAGVFAISILFLAGACLLIAAKPRPNNGGCLEWARDR